MARKKGYHIAPSLHYTRLLPVTLLQRVQNESRNSPTTDDGSKQLIRKSDISTISRPSSLAEITPPSLAPSKVQSKM